MFNLFVIVAPQFEAERFVDGLLGIGSAGGSKKKDEGKMLAQRLEVMRKERDARSKEKKAASNVPAKAGAVPAMSHEMDSSEYDDSDVVELAGASSSGARRPIGNPRASKKKRKRKNRK